MAIAYRASPVLSISVGMTRGPLANRFHIYFCSSLQIPIEDLLPIPVDHAGKFRNVIVYCFEIFDPERLPADVGMNGDGHKFWTFRALLVETVKLVGTFSASSRPLHLMLHDHHWNIIAIRSNRGSVTSGPCFVAISTGSSSHTQLQLYLIPAAVR